MNSQVHLNPRGFSQLKLRFRGHVLSIGINSDGDVHWIDSCMIVRTEKFDEMPPEGPITEEVCRTAGVEVDSTDARVTCGLDPEELFRIMKVLAA